MSDENRLDEVPGARHAATHLGKRDVIGESEPRGIHDKPIALAFGPTELVRNRVLLGCTLWRLELPGTPIDERIGSSDPCPIDGPTEVHIVPDSSKSSGRLPLVGKRESAVVLRDDPVLTRGAARHFATGA